MKNDERVPILAIVIFALVWLWLVDTGRWTAIKQLWSYPGAGYRYQTGGTGAVSESLVPIIPSGSSSGSTTSATSSAGNGIGNIVSTVVSNIGSIFGL